MDDCDLTAAGLCEVIPEAAPDLQVMYQEVSVMDEPGCVSQRERGTDSGDSKDLRGETAASATLNNNCQFETLVKRDEREGDGRRANAKEQVQREKAKRETEQRKTEDSKVISDLRGLSPGLGHGLTNNKDLQGSELRLLLLGESWSSRAPAGLTILGGEESLPSGPTARPWRGEIAGRQVSIAEPQGLSWRNGPDPSNAAQRQKLKDSLSQFNQRPHSVLLIIPAYLTFTRKYRGAVEHHMSFLGEDIWHRTMVLFTWGDVLGETAQQHILRNSDLMWLIEKCESRYHVLYNENNKSSQVKRLFERIEETIVRNN
ncbi:GTPase IMAP family member 6-like [Aplochiton taeniatus]